ncbi:MAG: V-type ATP synthase subunit D [Lentisphaerota bacterium]
MAKIKMTKTELKAQQDALKQFMRFLPMLQLKKQQLQMEIRKSQARLRENEEAAEAVRKNIVSWISLFSDEHAVKLLSSIIKVENVETGSANIGGVQVPVFSSISFTIGEYDLVKEDSWIDDAVETVKKIIELDEAHKIIEEQFRLLSRELKTTSQRVNLFEKIKIPECRENIRTIRIAIGNNDTAGVARSKIAKRKSQEAAA